MKIRSTLDVILLLLACLGAVTGIALVSVAALHGTRLDMVRSGGPLHGSGKFLAIPVVIGVASALFLAWRGRRS